MDREDMSLEERVSLLEFQVGLLSEGKEINRYIVDCGLTQEEYDLIVNTMETYQKKIAQKEEVHFGGFEAMIYDAVPSYQGDHHFCETIARLFMEDGRWEEVFPALYRVFPKYK